MKFGLEVPFKASNFGGFFFLCKIDNNTVPTHKVVLSLSGNNVLKVLCKMGSTIQISCVIILLLRKNNCHYYMLWHEIMKT